MFRRLPAMRRLARESLRALFPMPLALASLLATAPLQAQVAGSLSPANIAFGDVVVTTDSAPRLVTVTNTSAASAFLVTSLAMPFRYREVAGGSCPARPFSLPAGMGCTVALVFNPNSIGQFNGSFSVNTTPAATLTPASVAVGGNGVPVPMTLAPATLAYGDVEIGATSAAQTFAIRNADTAATVTVSGLSLPFRFGETAGGTCGARPFTLAAGASCTVRMAFAPNSAGSFPGSVSVTTTPATQFTPAAITAGGSGVPVPATLAPATLSFGNVSIGTTSAAQTLTIANASTMSAPLTVNSVSLPFRYTEVAGGTCAARPFTLNASESCTLRLAFSPSSTGLFNGNVSVSTTPSSTFAPASIAVSGNGTPLPVTLAPATLAFGNVTVGNTSAPQFATIANADAAGSLTVNSISFAFRYSLAPGGSCDPVPFVLGAGASCTVAVTFAPNSLGLFNGAISISTTPATTSTPSSITLAGSGTPVPGLFMPAMLDFGSVVASSGSARRTLTLANADPQAGMTVNSVALGFRYAIAGGTCGATPFALAAGGSCTLDLQFSPNVIGSFPGFVSVNTTPGSSFTPSQATLAGNGVSDALFEDGFE